LNDDSKETTGSILGKAGQLPEICPETDKAA
jgi:hypothetical protein